MKSKRIVIALLAGAKAAKAVGADIRTMYLQQMKIAQVMRAEEAAARAKVDIEEMKAREAAVSELLPQFEYKADEIRPIVQKYGQDAKAVLELATLYGVSPRELIRLAYK